MTTATQKIPSGYKQTEIGVIPADWDVKELGKVCKYQNGTSLERYFNQHDGYKVISIGSYSTSGNYIDNGSYISFDLRDRVNKFILNKDDLTMILNDKTSTGEIIGRVLLIEKSNSYVFNQRTMRLTPDSDVLPKYLYFLINSSTVHKKLARQAKPGTQIYFNTADILDFKISFPKDKTEQSTILNALSDADALVKKLEKLIEKKKDIKQGAMQELLTGKRRLSGFSKKWETKRLGDVGEIITGSTPPTQVKEYWNGLIPWITPTDISDKKDIHNSEREISFSGLQVIRKLPANTLLVTCIASIGKNAILRADGACNQQINAITPGKDYDVDFLYYLIENSKQYLLGNAGITATLMISKKDFSEITFSLPDKPEQVAIATVLSDMDIEIEKLESQLTKYQNIKQGMMQTLLTGKIRLLTK